MTETSKHRVEIFFMSDGSYHVTMDPDVEVYIGHEELSEYVLYKDNPIEAGAYLEQAPIILPPETSRELDPVNKLVLELA
jgi:hypothetical protein